MKHENFRKLCEEQLLGATTLSAGVTFPVRNHCWFHRLCDSIRDGLLFLRGCNTEFRQCIGLGLLVRAIAALNSVRNLEPHQLVKEGNFVVKEVDEFVGVADVFTCGHMRGDLHTLVEGSEALVTLAAPNFGEAGLHGVATVFISLIKS